MSLPSCKTSVTVQAMELSRSWSPVGRIFPSFFSYGRTGADTVVHRQIQVKVYFPGRLKAAKKMLFQQQTLAALSLLICTENVGALHICLTHILQKCFAKLIC